MPLFFFFLIILLPVAAVIEGGIQGLLCKVRGGPFGSGSWEITMPCLSQLQWELEGLSHGDI